MKIAHFLLTGAIVAIGFGAGPISQYAQTRKPGTRVVREIKTVEPGQTTPQVETENVATPTAVEPEPPKPKAIPKPTPKSTTPKTSPTKTIPTAKVNAKSTGPPMLVARGLTNEGLITKLFTGDFVNIDLDRTDNRFGILFAQYLDAYANSCKASLPADKVEMTQTRCVAWNVSRNRYGMELSRTCAEYETYGTGLYAKPTMYDALRTVNRQKAADVGRELSRTFGDYTKPNAVGDMVGLIGDAQSISSDMRSLVQLNACTASGLLRFEDNLRLFALNKQPIPLSGETVASSVIMPANGEVFKDQNYARLIEDLILDDTQRWGAFATFIRGSVNGASVNGRDKLGRPVSVTSPYVWEGMFGRTSGRVTLTFSDGLPECLTYSETSSVCHSPNRRIIASYVAGGYSK